MINNLQECFRERPITIIVQFKHTTSFFLPTLSSFLYMSVQRDYKFDEAFNIFDEIDNKCNELDDYRPRAPNNINNKNVMLESLRIIEDKLIDVFYS